MWHGGLQRPLRERINMKNKKKTLEEKFDWKFGKGSGYLIAEEHLHDIKLWLTQERKALLEEVKVEFQSSEMLPNISGYIGVDQAKQWIYEILEKLTSKE